MNDWHPHKAEPGESLGDITESLSKQPLRQQIDRIVVKEYLYWSFRVLLFSVAINAAIIAGNNEPLAAFFERNSIVKLLLLHTLVALVGPAIFVLWSQLWMRLHDLFRRSE